MQEFSERLSTLNEEARNIAEDVVAISTRAQNLEDERKRLIEDVKNRIKELTTFLLGLNKVKIKVKTNVK